MDYSIQFNGKTMKLDDTGVTINIDYDDNFFMYVMDFEELSKKDSEVNAASCFDEIVEYFEIGEYTDEDKEELLTVLEHALIKKSKNGIA